MTNNNEKHAVLIEHGWRVGVAGRWRSPDPAGRHAYTLATAWIALTDTPEDAA